MTKQMLLLLKWGFTFSMKYSLRNMHTSKELGEQRKHGIKQQLTSLSCPWIQITPNSYCCFFPPCIFHCSQSLHYYISTLHLSISPTHWAFWFAAVCPFLPLSLSENSSKPPQPTPICSFIERADEEGREEEMCLCARVITVRKSLFSYFHRPFLNFSFFYGGGMLCSHTLC